GDCPVCRARDIKNLEAARKLFRLWGPGFPDQLREPFRGMSAPCVRWKETPPTTIARPALDRRSLSRLISMLDFFPHDHATLYPTPQTMGPASETSRSASWECAACFPGGCRLPLLLRLGHAGARHARDDRHFGRTDVRRFSF